MINKKLMDNILQINIKIGINIIIIIIIIISKPLISKEKFDVFALSLTITLSSDINLDVIDQNDDNNDITTNILSLYVFVFTKYINCINA